MKNIRLLSALIISFFIYSNIAFAQDTQKSLILSGVKSTQDLLKNDITHKSIKALSVKEFIKNFISENTKLYPELNNLINQYYTNSNFREFIILFTIISRNGKSKYLLTYELIHVLSQKTTPLFSDHYYYLNLYDLNSGKIINSFDASQLNSFSSLIPLGDQQFAASVSSFYDSVLIFNLINNNKINLYSNLEGRSPMEYSPVRSELITNSKYNWMEQYNLLLSKKEQNRYDIHSFSDTRLKRENVKSISCSPNGKYIVLASDHSHNFCSFMIYDLSETVFDALYHRQEYKPLDYFLLEGCDHGNTRAKKVAWSKDGNYLVASYIYEKSMNDHVLEIVAWDVKDIGNKNKIEIFRKQFSFSDFALVNNYLAYFDGQNNIIITDLDNKYHDIKIKTDFKDLYLNIQVSLDQKYLAARSNSEVKLWTDPMRMIAALRKRRLELVL